MVKFLTWTAGNDVYYVKLDLIFNVKERSREMISVGILLITMLSSRHLGPKVVSNIPKVLGDRLSCFGFVTGSGLGWVEGSVRVVSVVSEERGHSGGL